MRAHYAPLVLRPRPRIVPRPIRATLVMEENMQYRDRRCVWLVRQTPTRRRVAETRRIAPAMPDLRGPLAGLVWRASRERINPPRVRKRAHYAPLVLRPRPRIVPRPIRATLVREENML